MGENSTTTEPRLKFTTAGLTTTEAQGCQTAYVATAEGVTYRIVGTPTATDRTRRTFRAFRVTDNGGRTLTPAAEGGEHKTRKAAAEQAERDLAAVLADRAAKANVAVIPGCGVELQTFPYGYCTRPAGHGSFHDRPGVDPAPRRVIITEPDRDATQQVADRPLRTGGVVDSGVYTINITAPDADLAEAIRRAVCAPVPVSPPADPVAEDRLPALHERVVRRAQYEALKVVLSVLAGWIEGAQENCVALEHGSAGRHDDSLLCGERFHADDIRTMINDAARELGTSEPWQGGPDA